MKARVLGVAAWFFLAAAAAAAEEPSFEAQPCAGAELAEARCGLVRVPEDRLDPGGRQIAINVVILPAVGPVRLPPIYDLDGGPGLPATKNVGFYLSFGGAYRQG